MATDTETFQSVTNEHISIVTVRKVMFLYLSVILFTGVGGVSQRALGQTPPGQTYPSMHLDRHPQQTSPRQTPPYGQMATAADGTHPTGMPSCILHYLPQ